MKLWCAAILDDIVLPTLAGRQRISCGNVQSHNDTRTGMSQ